MLIKQSSHMFKSSVIFQCLFNCYVRLFNTIFIMLSYAYSKNKLAILMKNKFHVNIKFSLDYLNKQEKKAQIQKRLGLKK